jgi:surfeit locus 1 family protein
MRPSIAVAATGLLIAAGVSVRLGIWQLSRYEQKKALNAAHQAALARAPESWDGSPRSVPRLIGRRVRMSGRYDATHHVLIAYREREGVPGVELVTPLVLEDGQRVLVNRGWIPAEDEQRARPQDYPEPGIVLVVGVAESLMHARFGMFALESDSVSVLSARALDRDTVAARLPGPLAPFLLRQLPGSGVPSTPRRSAPEPLETGMHLGYAAQWFVIAAVILVGGFAFLRSRQRPGGGRP